MVARTTSGGWIISHRCSWITVYVFCRNAQSQSHSDHHDICTLSLFYQLPKCNLFSQHVVIYLMERHHLWTVDSGPISFTLLLVINPCSRTTILIFNNVRALVSRRWCFPKLLRIAFSYLSLPYVGFNGDEFVEFVRY
jgi:hypothetical protein